VEQDLIRAFHLLRRTSGTRPYRLLGHGDLGFLVQV
jgi:hypothetical protein